MVPAFLIPKKFLFRFPLAVGALIFGILFICVKIVCILAIIVEIVGFAKCESCTRAVLRSAYGFSGTAIIHCIIMIFVHLWFLWAVKKSVPSVVIIWVVVTEIWLIQTTCLMSVMLCMLMASASFIALVLSLVFGIIAFAIADYGVVVGYGLWLEMKSQTMGNTQENTVA